MMNVFVCFFRAGTDLNIIQFLDIFRGANQNQLTNQKTKKQKELDNNLLALAWTFMKFDVANFCSCENINYVYIQNAF